MIGFKHPVDVTYNQGSKLRYNAQHHAIAAMSGFRQSQKPYSTMIVIGNSRIRSHLVIFNQCDYNCKPHHHTPLCNSIRCRNLDQVLMLSRRPRIRINPVIGYGAQKRVRDTEGTDQGKCMWSKFSTEFWHFFPHSRSILC